MQKRNKTVLLLFLILGFITMLIGGFLLIFGAIMENNLMMYISLGFIMLAVALYSILLILFIIYMAKRR